MKLEPQDLDKAVRLLPTRLVDLMVREGKKVVVAGGYLRSILLRERIKDIDVFSPSAEIAEKNFRVLSTESSVTQNTILDVIITGNAYTIKKLEGKDVQFIHKWCYPTPEALIKSFDFTISCAAFWWDEDKNDWDSVVDEKFYHDCAAKRLTFRFPNRKEEPAGSILRVLKFAQRGYTIDNKSLAGVAVKLVGGSVAEGNIVCDYDETVRAVCKSVSRCSGHS